MRRTWIVGALAGALLLAGASGASAGVYSVEILGPCEGKPSPFQFATSDRAMDAFAECGIGRAVVTQSRPGQGALSKAYAEAVFAVPAGTTLDRMDVDAEFRRIDCRWDLHMLAGDVRVMGVDGFDRCDVMQVLDPVSVDLRQASELVQRVQCVDPDGCPASAVGLSSGSFEIRSAVIDVRDEVPPRIESLSLGGSAERWVGGVQTLRYDARDGSGIKETRMTVAGQATERHVAACDYTRAAPCPDGGGELPLDTTRLANGGHRVTVEVVDTGGNTSAASVSARVDNTPPARVQASVEGGSDWRRQNAFTLSWSAAPEDHAPIAAAQYRLCRAGTTECVRGSRAGTGIERLADLGVPGPGEWTLETWREDEAGNADERLASPPVRLRFDDAPPALAFEPRPAEDPRRVSALVSDGVSGVAGAELQLRLAGTASWRSLPARLDGGRLVGQVDDDRLPAGAYELRARASDHAGNEGSASTQLQLPLRARPRLSAGIVKAGKKPRLLRSARARFGAKLGLSGRLTNQAGRPIAGAKLRVFSRSRGGRERSAGTVTTNRAGEFTYALRARASGTVRVLYEGSRQLGPTQRDVALEVPAAAVLTTSHRRALNGQSIILRGHLRGRPFPPKGKIIQLQAYLPRQGWNNFGEALRADRNGHWRVPYRFNNTRGTIHYRFRILIPREQDYPFETGASNVVRVTVRGR